MGSVIRRDDANVHLEDGAEYIFRFFCSPHRTLLASCVPALRDESFKSLAPLFY